MTKALVLSCLALLTLSNAALADDWYNRYDRDHDGRWSYNEFRSAHNNYWKHHRHEQRMNDAALHSQYSTWSVGHPGYVEREQVREFHHWDN